MRTGNLTKVSRESAIENAPKMWCPNCEEWMNQEIVDASYDDQYGTITEWHASGRCDYCGEDMLDIAPDEDESGS